MSGSDPEPPVSKPIPIPSFRPSQVFRRAKNVSEERKDAPVRAGQTQGAKRSER